MIVKLPPMTHEYTPLKVVLMSGLSDPHCCALSSIQKSFMDQLEVPKESKIYANFPYLTDHANINLPVSIWQASYRNLTQFLGVKRKKEHYQAHWKALVDSCDRLLVITLSCGLEILNTCLNSGAKPDSVYVLALGPVAWNRPSVEHILVQGARDYVSRPFFRKVDITLPKTGHLDYLQHESILELIGSERCYNILKS